MTAGAEKGPRGLGDVSYEQDSGFYNMAEGLKACWQVTGARVEMGGAVWVGCLGNAVMGAMALSRKTGSTG